MPALALAAIAVSAAACGHREDDHSGQPIVAWYGKLRSPDPRVREQAANVIASAAPDHPETLNALLAALETEGDSDVHVVLAGALGALGPSAASAVPALVRLTRDDHEEVRSAAVALLPRIGIASPAVLSGLQGALRDRSHDVRAAAADAIGVAARSDSGAARAMVSALTTAMNDPIGYVRWRAMRTLAVLPAPDSLVLPLFARGLTDDFSKVRTAACVGAGRRGSRAASLEPVLRRLSTAREDDEETREACGAALRSLTTGTSISSFSP